MSSLEIILVITGLILTAIGILVAVASMFVQMITGVFPLSYIEEKKKQKLLNEKFSRGPYDKLTIERSTKYYIQPKCSNIDPAQELELRHALMATRESLFDKVDHFIFQDSSNRHLLLLADSGTGKTSFVLNYYAQNYRRLGRKQINIAIVPLGIPNAEILIENIPEHESTVIFLDALDEDTKAISNHGERITFLMDKCRSFKKVIITCRTQFFPKGEEIPVETGILRLGPRKAGDKGVYEFWKLYLSPFDDGDVKKYINRRYPFWQNSLRKKALELVSKIPLLSVRPMLLAHVPDVLEKKKKIQSTSELYEVMVDAWYEREIFWVNKEELRAFSEKVAVNIYLNRTSRGAEGVSYAELQTLAIQWNIKLQPWQLGGRSLLNRDARDNYKFAHRSIMEYLFVKNLYFTRETFEDIALTDQMRLFLVETCGDDILGSLFNLIDGSALFSLMKLSSESWQKRNIKLKYNLFEGLVTDTLSRQSAIALHSFLRMKKDTLSDETTSANLEKISKTIFNFGSKILSISSAPLSIEPFISELINPTESITDTISKNIASSLVKFKNRNRPYWELACNVILVKCLDEIEKTVSTNLTLNVYSESGINLTAKDNEKIFQKIEILSRIITFNSVSKEMFLYVDEKNSNKYEIVFIN